MRQIVTPVFAVLSAIGLLAATSLPASAQSGSRSYLVRPENSRLAVLDNEANAAGGATPLVSLDKVDRFDCSRPKHRHPRETKSQEYDATTEDRGTCTDGGNCC